MRYGLYEFFKFKLCCYIIFKIKNIIIICINLSFSKNYYFKFFERFLHFPSYFPHLKVFPSPLLQTHKQSLKLLVFLLLFCYFFSFYVLFSCFLLFFTFFFGVRFDAPVSRCNYFTYLFIFYIIVYHEYACNYSCFVGIST